MPSDNRNLVISPIGDDSMHASWLADRPARTFDVFLVHYGKRADFGRGDADYYVSRRGFKWELLDYVARVHSDVLQRYDRIWCPDCDIRSDTAGVNRLFALCEEYHLQLAQPAIAAGDVTYQVLRKRPGLVLRYTPFVEVMCPLFTRDAFFAVQSTFLESRSGWGLDLLWPRLFQPREMAVLDAVGVEHTGPLFRGENYKNLYKLGVNPGEELQRVIANHGGFDRRLHRKLLRGRIKLPAVWESERSIGLAERLLEKIGLRRSYA